VDVFFPNIESTMSDAPLDVSLDMHSVHTEFNKDNYVDFQIGLSETIKFQEYLYKN
jgi:hypothetical protein